LEGKDLSTFKSFMSIRNMTFKYEEHEMEVEGLYNDVMVAINENEEVKIANAGYVFESFPFN